MLLTQYFLPTLKTNPKYAQTISHKLMIRSGMIKQESAGIYSWLPLGLRVLKKIINIIENEHELIGAIQLLMPTIQPAQLWIKSGRYDVYGKEMLRIKDRYNRHLLYSPTNEEMITNIFKQYITSYKYLPLILYQIQWKFRDEIRPKNGIIRAREFLMKDAYSFDINQQEFIKTYNKIFICYLRIFKKLDLLALPIKANNGPIGGEYSHEFFVISSQGEHKIFADKNIFNANLLNVNNNIDSFEIMKNNYFSYYIATQDTHNEKQFQYILKNNQFIGYGIEVGHIFNFGVKYSKVLNANIDLCNGHNHSVYMGSYGIGISRLIAAIIEVHHDKYGIIWPLSVAPFQIALINLHINNKIITQYCNDLYHKIISMGIEVLYDNTINNISSKLSIMNLIGIPFQIITTNKSKVIEFEFKIRSTGKKIFLSMEEILNKLNHLF